MKILGIDPGLATVGIGIVEANGPTDMWVEDWFTIETKAGMDFAQRLVEIGNDLDGILTETKPDIAVVERLYFSVNEKTALDVAHARGVLLARLAAQSITILEPGPMELKSAITGDGRADKQQIQDMVVRILQLDEIPTPDDAADALALAIFGALQ